MDKRAASFTVQMMAVCSSEHC